MHSQLTTFFSSRRVIGISYWWRCNRSRWINACLYST